jgi:predicted DNA binding CopG/RHH family protein
MNKKNVAFTKQLNVRVTEAELTTIKEQAKRGDMSVTDFIRKSLSLPIKQYVTLERI